jgi:two-component system response regulator
MAAAFQPLSILLVDDSEDDILMAQKVFTKLNLPHKLTIAMNAAQALDYLNCTGRHSGRKPAEPDLLLLDINMPGMDGLQLLKKIKADKRLRKIPVIMLTTSASREDIRKSFENGAASFLTKPNSFEEYSDLMAQFSKYWTSVSARPK